jgi:hypothetical protein
LSRSALTVFLFVLFSFLLFSFPLFSFLAPPAAWASAATVLDSFDDVNGWTAEASHGARLDLARDAGPSGGALRLDFDLGDGGGYVIARKALPISLPANYAFAFQMRGETPPLVFEFKLVDRSGNNVWRHRRPDFTPPRAWEQMTLPKRRIDFAWGPVGGGDVTEIGHIELALASTPGVKGSLWIDDLRLETREPAARTGAPPLARASSSAPGHGPEWALDGDPASTWRSGDGEQSRGDSQRGAGSEPPRPDRDGAAAERQWLLLDLHERREYGGLVIEWDADDYATAYQIQVSDDGTTWTGVHRNAAGNGGRDYVPLPDAESRYIKLDLEQSSRGQGYAIRGVALQPFEFSASPNQFFETLARGATPGMFPKYFSGIQSYWTVVGVDGDEKEALVNEEGMIEVDDGTFSIEPFLHVDGRLVSWRSMRTTQALADGDLPIPSVTWQEDVVDAVGLQITTFAAGPAGRSILYADYAVQNRGAAPREIVLFLALRPFQVLPPWQSLNRVGGVAPIRTIEGGSAHESQAPAFRADTVLVNATKAIRSLTPPDGFGAATLEEGDITEFLARGVVPTRSQVTDPDGYASAALQYRLTLAPGAEGHVFLAIPFHDPHGADDIATGSDRGAAHVAAVLRATAETWRRMFDRVGIQVPPDAEPLVRTARTTLAYVLINRDGPAIKPGSRTYARSWIRDGAITAAALLDMGFPETVRDFIRWYAGYQQRDGKIPCCVDHRGADPVPEHDSAGEFIYTVAEYYRYTRDAGLVKAQWPVVVRAVEYMTALRRQRLTEEYTRPDRLPYFGLMPESISHEGYAARPVHSYWDDFWALRGFKDAASLAGVVGDQEHATSFAALRDAFQRDLYTSITRTMTLHRIDYIPASVELGDFDPSSTAIAISPGGELEHLPQPALTVTFDRYFEGVQQRRRDVGDPNSAYTPYELRNVGALVRMNQRQRALELLWGFVNDQRPRGWNQWPELLWQDPGVPKFIGDMPHTWVASSFVRAVRDLFVYERESDDTLVVAAGLSQSMVTTAPGVTVRRLPTYYGTLDLDIRRSDHQGAAQALTVRLGGDLTVPSGGFVIQPPADVPIQAVTVNGRSMDTFTAETATVRELPAEVVLQY